MDSIHALKERGERELDAEPQATRTSSLDAGVLHDLHASIAKLADLLQSVPAAEQRARAGADTMNPTTAPLDLKRLLELRAKRRRNSFGQFLDWPSWDMLLDLAAVKAENGHVSVSAICVSSGAPQSTALRKLGGLEGAGLVHRYLHDKDRRRVCVSLTDEGSKLVRAMIIEDLLLFSDWAEKAVSATPDHLGKPRR